jgi:hypothetical protein
VFVAHYTPLKERKEALLEEIAKAGISGVRFVEDFDREVLTDAVIKEAYAHFRYLAEDLVGEGDEEELPYTAYKMSDKEVSLAIKQLEALKIVVREDHPMALIIEDDAILTDDFATKLMLYISQLKDGEWDVLCIGNEVAKCEELHECRERTHGSNVFRKSWHSGRSFDMGAVSS